MPLTPFPSKSVNLRQLSLTVKLLIPFTIIFILTIGGLGTFFIHQWRVALTRDLEKKAEILVRNLAVALSDSFPMGEYEKMQEILTAAKHSDPDIDYEIVIGMDGRAIASTVANLRDQLLNRTEFETSAIKTTDFRERPRADQEGFEVLMPTSFQGHQSGVIRIGVSLRRVDAAAKQGFLTFMLVGGIALILGVIVYVLVAQRFSRPLRLAVARLEELASGAADLNLRLPITSQDEVGQLGQSLNRFLESLSHLVRQIRQSSEQVASSAKSLQQITQQSSANINQAVQVMSQISQNTSQVAQSTQAAANSSQHVGKSAEDGGRLAIHVVEKMKEAQSSVAAAAGFIHELGKRSDQIGKIVDVITKIADQTNLLSLNAAIEAARAGESGRGFAVVADEIRKLAETSADSTQQIIHLIREVQEETRHAIETTEKGNREVADGYRLTMEAEKLFSTIAREVSQMTHQMTQVASNTEEVAASTEEATASSEEQSAAMEQVATNARELGQVVEKLRTLVGEFKTG